MGNFPKHYKESMQKNNRLNGAFLPTFVASVLLEK